MAGGFSILPAPGDFHRSRSQRYGKGKVAQGSPSSLAVLPPRRDRGRRGRWEYGLSCMRRGENPRRWKSRRAEPRALRYSFLVGSDTPHDAGLTWRDSFGRGRREWPERGLPVFWPLHRGREEVARGSLSSPAALPAFMRSAVLLQKKPQTSKAEVCATALQRFTSMIDHHTIPRRLASRVTQG
jgi:hypothetical protein